MSHNWQKCEPNKTSEKKGKKERMNSNQHLFGCRCRRRCRCCDCESFSQRMYSKNEKKLNK